MRSWTDSREAKGPKHQSFGMQRLCELELLAQISEQMEGFVVIGCGLGYEFERTKCKYQLGIDRVDANIPNITYWKRDIIINDKMNEKVITELKDWRNLISGNVLWYTDNGYKMAELTGIVSLLKTGDIVGTHDLGTEVPFQFYKDLCVTHNLRDMKEYDNYINQYFCLQGFAVRK
jgi:hypothetical protein